MNRKAKHNLDIAQHLLNMKNEKYCAAVVHCSYYAVLQYMKFLLANTANNPIPYEKQTDKTDGHGSHEYILLEVRNRLSNGYKAKDIVEDIRNLRKHRIEADYTTTSFSLEEGLDCRADAARIIEKLKI